MVVVAEVVSFALEAGTFVSRPPIRSPTTWRASAASTDLPIGRGSSAGAMSPSSTTISAVPAAALRGPALRSCWPRSAKDASAPWSRSRRRGSPATAATGTRCLEFCGLVGTLIVDEDGVYDPRHPNDRLLLGMKGTMSEMELSVLRQRSLEALKQKARRGELFMTVAIGYVRVGNNRIEKDPDRRIQEAIALVFTKFDRDAVGASGASLVPARAHPFARCHLRCGRAAGSSGSCRCTTPSCTF